MKKVITAEERQINILNNAVIHGFEIDENKSFRDVIDEATSFILDNEIDRYEVEVNVETSGKNQCVVWCDDFGYQYEISGEIVDYSNRRAGEKIYHSSIVDGLGRFVELFEVMPA